ncbi:MAG: phosphoglycerate dehydrogenase [Chloroflexota bacterium]
MADKLLLAARTFRKTEGPHWGLLRDAGYDLIESPYDRPLKAEEVAALATEVTGIILGVDQISEVVFQQAKQLKAVSRYGVGLDNIDLAAATRHGVVVTSTPGANSLAVAELTIGLILALARHIPRHDQLVKAGSWQRIQGAEIAGETLGLVGFGNIGRHVAKRALAFDMRILYYDPFPPPPALLETMPVEASSLQRLLKESDVVSLHLPLTADTRNLIDAQALLLMKPTATLINSARGGLIDELALYQALANGHLAGAACDAFAQEPPGENPLLTLDNFIATPHSGAATHQTAHRTSLLAAENLLAVLRGERPNSVVNPEVFKTL